MLLVIKEPGSLRYAQLMELYQEDILAAAEKEYSALPHYRALAEAEQDLYGYYTDMLRAGDGAFCAFWAPENAYRAGLRMEVYEDGFLLTGLCTAPAHRRKGYARQLIQQMLAMLSQDRVIYSHVDKSNLPSVALHEKCGFQRSLPYGIMLDGSLLHNFWTYTLRK